MLLLLFFSTHHAVGLGGGDDLGHLHHGGPARRVRGGARGFCVLLVAPLRHALAPKARMKAGRLKINH